MAVENGRQVSPTIAGIRDDHRKRYKFAADIFANFKVIDAACGVGYGSKILAERNCKVQAYDIDPNAVAYARWHYRDPLVTTHLADILNVNFPSVDAVVSFETIEHLKNPEILLKSLRDSADFLLGSVPNQDVNPFDKNRHIYHERHYTFEEISYLLTKTGWTLNYVWSQEGKEGEAAEIKRSSTGATIIFGATSGIRKFPLVAT